MCEVGWTDSWWKRKVEVSIRRKTRKVFTKENSSCQAFINVKFNEVLKFSGTVKISGFDTFAISKSWGGGYHINYGHPLKLSSRTHLHGVDTFHVYRNLGGHLRRGDGSSMTSYCSIVHWQCVLLDMLGGLGVLTLPDHKRVLICSLQHCLQARLLSCP
jgi:hypothetical protein